MLPFIAPPTSAAYAHAIAWADRLYSATTYSDVGDDWRRDDGLTDAMDAYRQIERRFGRSVRTQNGLGNCLLDMGRYGEAIKVYPSGPRREEAWHRLRLANECAPFANGRSVIQIERVPDSKDRWIVLFAKRSRSDDRDANAYTKIGIQQVRERGSSLRPLAAELSRDKSEAEEHPEYIDISTLRLGKIPVVVLRRDYWRFNEDALFVQISSDRLRTIESFHSEYNSDLPIARLLPPNSKHGMRVVVQPTHKVFWPDVYEWKGGRFRFASQDSPELFSGLGSMSKFLDGYADWMKYAAKCGIDGRWSSALRAWRKADRLIKWEVHAFARTDFGFAWDWMGHPAENLKEIRQRVRWIQSGDHNHALLYRPQDMDLQIPPYRLGDAMPRLMRQNAEGASKH